MHRLMQIPDEMYNEFQCLYPLFPGRRLIPQELLLPQQHIIDIIPRHRFDLLLERGITQSNRQIDKMPGTRLLVLRLITDLVSPGTHIRKTLPTQ
jgi:hypothetical protein